MRIFGDNSDGFNNEIEIEKALDFKTYELSPQNRNETTGEYVLKTKYWTTSTHCM